MANGNDKKCETTYYNPIYNNRPIRTYILHYIIDISNGSRKIKGMTTSHYREKAIIPFHSDMSLFILYMNKC